MPKYKLKVDSRRRITLPQPVTDSVGDVGEEVYLSPNTVTALLHRKNIPLDDIIRSTKLLLEMLEHEEALRKKGNFT